MATETYSVAGMSCAHCVDAVSGELRQLPGVTEIKVDLAAGTVTVTSDRDLDRGAVREAVDEAGYELVS
jgi:copper chaperone